MSEITRRALLQKASAALVAGLPQSGAAQAQSRPHTGWEHYRGNLGGGESTIAVTSKDLPAAFLRIA
jgi:hypothetical protein